MGLWQAIVLGLVQGLTEFVPVSSSAHLIIVPWLLRWQDPGLAFDAALHLGTLAAVLCYFRRDWIELAKGFGASVAERRIGTDRNRLMAWYIIIGSIPGGIAGLLLEHTVESVFHEPTGHHMLIVALLVAALACVLALAEGIAKHNRPLGKLGWRDGMLIGIAQAAAVLPGVSRSGATITAGLLLGLEREAAARFSFLLAGPIIAGAGLKKVYDLYKHHLLTGDQTAIFVVGVLVAAVVGYLCIAWLLRYLQRRTTMPFVWYRLGLAVFVAAVVMAR